MRVASAIGLLLLLAGCVTLAERTYNITAAQVQKKINDRLLTPIPLLKVFHVNLTNSLVKFDGKNGRMQTTFDVDLAYLPTNKHIAGKLVVSGELRLDSMANSIVLDEVEVEQLSLDDSEDLKFGTTLYQAKNIQITDRGLQMTFSPIK
jgi:hypothetical protein